MKIVAYSKVPTSTPFVHLGYLAASTTLTKPIQGLLLGGVILLSVGLSMAGKRLLKRRRPAPVVEANAPRISRFGPVGSILLVAGTATIACAFLFGEKNRVFHYPKEATWTHMEMFSHTAVNRFEPRNSHLTKPPTQEGQYDLSKALGLSGDLRKHSTDGWNTPLVLRVIRHETQLEYVIVSAGPDRTLGTQDDLTSTELLKTRQTVDLPES